MKGIVKTIDRFNRNPKESNFYSIFQEILTERLILNYMGNYHEDNIKQIVRRIGKRPNISINTKIKNGFLLSCRVEPELYLKVQDTIKKLTGDYSAMDDLIHNLLAYFCYIYANKKPKFKLPYHKIREGKMAKNLKKFENIFGRYYKNIPKTLSRNI